MSRVWAEASARRLQVSLSCAVLCQIVSLQYLSRSSLRRLAGLPCRLFLSYGLHVVTREVHRSSLRRLTCPAQDHFSFLTLLIMSLVFPFWSVRPQVCSVLVRSVSRSLHHYVIAGSTQELYTCLFRQVQQGCI